ncbi:hypothetical protein QR680_016144 [Steinernema hermaphroditum]|uniref:Uncharacterized protein n=1 Tax=Steinernema hermaphroditum TaxID=289476 RepID=A0AA39HA70_9BILA|nr:hypothetical protein QR680_016144 [Steinernema hermaphroditum]
MGEREEPSAMMVKSSTVTSRDSEDDFLGMVTPMVASEKGLPTIVVATLSFRVVTLGDGRNNEESLEEGDQWRDRLDRTDRQEDDAIHDRLKE